MKTLFIAYALFSATLAVIISYDGICIDKQNLEIKTQDSTIHYLTVKLQTDAILLKDIVNLTVDGYGEVKTIFKNNNRDIKEYY